MTLVALIPGLRRRAERDEHSVSRACLFGILALAFAVRLGVILSGPYIVHSDELFQYYEQAHRVAFGNGVVPWEFHDGARSWLLPGILAAIMKASRWVASDPIVYLDAVRILCALLSLTVVYAGFELARRRDGLFAALLTGAICAIWIDPIYLAPSVMGEVLSAYCFLAAFLVTDPAVDGDLTTRRMAAAGMLLGLAVCLRVQIGPAMAIFALLRCRTEWRRCWLPLVAGGVIVVLVDLGLLDLLTWGAPFHSVWHYLLRGMFEKFGGGYADGPGTVRTYAELIAAAWTPRALPLVFLLLLGAFRLPSLATVAAVAVGTHFIFAHAEYRYLSCALLVCPILIGAGATYLCETVRRIGEAHNLRQGATNLAAGAAILGYVAFASFIAASDGLLFRTLDRNILDALLLAHRQPQLCGLAAVGVGWADGWSYTYLDRDVPLYGGSYSATKPIGPDVSVAQSVVLDGVNLPVYSDDELVRRTTLFNYLIAPPGQGIDGFTPVACVGHDGNPANPPLCLYRRPGGCELPPASSQGR